VTSPVPDDGIRSRQRQLAGDLRALILSGDIGPGERLPTTAELTRRYGVNNMTVTRALAILKAEGLVEGRKGKAVISTDRRPAVVRASHYPQATDGPFPWITEAASRERIGSSRLIEVGEQPAPAQVAAAFGIATGAPVVMRHQLLLLDGEPAELVWSYYPLEIARRSPRSDFRCATPWIRSRRDSRPSPSLWLCNCRRTYLSFDSSGWRIRTGRAQWR
jgi:GntR family transcriptional regulator